MYLQREQIPSELHLTVQDSTLKLEIPFIFSRLSYNDGKFELALQGFSIFYIESMPGRRGAQSLHIEKGRFF